MGIVPRMEILKKKGDEECKKRLQMDYERLVLPGEMGQLYKVQIVTKKSYGEIYPFLKNDPNVV
jgi:SAM-dependent MidA family methyltransferase